MATVLICGNSEGSRRCDATCHNATHEKCACVCGGRFHGGNLSPEGLAGRVHEFAGEIEQRLGLHPGELVKAFEKKESVRVGQGAVQQEMFSFSNEGT